MPVSDYYRSHQCNRMVYFVFSFVYKVHTLIVEVCLVVKYVCSYLKIYCKKFVYISCIADVKYFKGIDKILCNDFVLKQFITAYKSLAFETHTWDHPFSMYVTVLTP